MFNKILVQCVATRIATILVSAGIKPIFVIDLISESGEIFTKFFNIDRTPAGNYTVKRNSDFAKLYRITIGISPAGGFFRCDRILDHLLGHHFLVDYQLKDSKKRGEYLKVTSIYPQHPIVTDSWTLTGQLIKTVRKNPCGNPAAFSRFSAEIERKTRGTDSALGRVATGLEPRSNPIYNLPSKALKLTTPSIDISYIGKGEVIQVSTSPPLVDLASTEPTNHQIH